MRSYHKISLLKTICHVTCSHVLPHYNCYPFKIQALTNMSLAMVITVTIIVDITLDITVGIVINITVGGKKTSVYRKRKT